MTLPDCAGELGATLASLAKRRDLVHQHMNKRTRQDRLFWRLRSTHADLVVTIAMLLSSSSLRTKESS